MSAAASLQGLLFGPMLLLAACSEADRSRVRPELTGAGLRLSALLGETQQSGYASARPDYQLRFPEDHGPHGDFRSEWWYLTLLLEDEHGRSYGGQFTLFRQALTAPAAGAELPARDAWSDPQLYMAHLAVSDVSRQQQLEAERFSRNHQRLAGARAQPFALWIDDWRLESEGEESFFPLRLKADAAAFGWSLTVRGERPPALQGTNGFSPKGPGQASHYYSYTRLSASGQLTLAGQRIPVSGTAWFDREWSTSLLGAEQVGWDWLALQLVDGRDIMVFRLRRRDCIRDPYDHGLLVHADGAYEALEPSRFELVPVAWWQPEDERLPAALCAGEASGYPIRWRLRVDDEWFDVEAAFEDQRMQTAVSYWEGLVWVNGHGERIGKGYLEMTGYGGP